MKPIIRWTIGYATTAGNRSLRYSIRKFKAIYKDRFDYYVMFNSNRPPDIGISQTNIVSQKTMHFNSLPHKPIGPAWKLYPPRLNITVPEIFIDNDLIIYKEIEEIETLLEKNTPFITEDAYRLYGNYNSLIDKDISINSGFFGLPVGFDFRQHILENSLANEWEDNWDEQGLVAKIMIDIKATVIPLTRINVLVPEVEGVLGTHGTHFVVLNKAKTHLSWNKFVKTMKKEIKVI